MWPASLVMMFIGVAVSIIADKVNFFYFVAPLIASAALALIYGPENDAATELTFATPTSPWKVLLARMTLVSAFNLVLGLIATVVISQFLQLEMFWGLVLAWLAPMTFLSMLALFLSIWVGTGNAILATYGLWLVQYIPLTRMGLWAQTPQWLEGLVSLREFWNNPGLLFALSLILLVLALFSTRRSQRALIYHNA